MQPLVTLAVVSVLPLGVRQLELGLPCAEPLPALLLRFRQLQQLSLRTGGLNWHSSSGTFVLRRLEHLVLDYRQRPEWEEGNFSPADVHSLDSTDVAVFSAATRLTSLELRIQGTQHLRELGSALPALHELR